MEQRDSPMPPTVPTGPRRLPRIGRSATWPLLAIGYGVVLWAIVVGLVMLVGRWILPGLDSGRLLPALVAIEAVTAVVVAVVTVDFLRRSRADSTADGVRFGAWATIVGMTADGILLLVTDFDLQGITAAETRTFVVALFFGYPITLITTWVVAGLRLRGRRV